MKVKIYTHSEANSEPCQTSKMELFAKLINGFFIPPENIRKPMIF